VTTSNVVNLGQVRNLLAEWDKVREHIIAGDIAGWAATIRNNSGRETVYLGGVFRNDSRLTLSAALRMSTARVMEEDEPPAFANSQFP
jgi:hypothetical protein